MIINLVSTFRRTMIILGLAYSVPAFAQGEAEATTDVLDAFAIRGRYVLDVMGVAAGGEKRGVRGFDNLELEADTDLDTLVGWRGAQAHLHFLSNQGASVNNLAGTLQGIDNIEVSKGNAKLYQAWIEQNIAGGRASLLVGLSDLNADFYQNDSAGLLIAPAFGIGSELAATGPNGPSIFPSTAITMRLNIAVAKTGYVRAAVVNARAGVPGDAAGVDMTMRDGALLIAEAGIAGRGKLSVGAWYYTRRQDDIRTLDSEGRPVTRVAAGAYFLMDRPLTESKIRSIDFFLRAGASEGKTTPFRGGFQTGLLVNHAISGRPDSQVSIGLAYALLSRRARDNLRELGISPGPAETGIEITYQDRLAPFLSVQPDFQYVHRAYSEEGRRSAFVVGLRLVATLGGD